MNNDDLPTMYFRSDEKHYRLKVSSDTVYIERQASPAAPAMQQESFMLQAFPVLYGRYWNWIEVEHLAAWYEGYMNQPPVMNYDDLFLDDPLDIDAYTETSGESPLPPEVCESFERAILTADSIDFAPDGSITWFIDAGTTIHTAPEDMRLPENDDRAGQDTTK